MGAATVVNTSQSEFRPRTVRGFNSI